MNERLTKIKTEFDRLYGDSDCRFFRAPGRVNIIGEHTDYNDGYVLPMAIDLDVVVAARIREDLNVRVVSADFPVEAEFSMRSGVKDPAAPWVQYTQGVAFFFSEKFPSAVGIDAYIQGTVPIGSGLSSSAAVEVATALALLGTNGLSMDRKDLARLCQRAENEFVGARCGIMDQMTSACAEAGSALYLDCRSLDSSPVALPSTVSVVICDTMKRRELASSEYNRRREECEEAVRVLRNDLPGINALRDVTGDDLERHRHRLPPIPARRAKHIVSENQRVIDTVSALKQGNLREVGMHMADSHESLRALYEVSCKELDLMVGVAQEAPGCIGARMTGGGFGGSTVNLVWKSRVSEFVESVMCGYKSKTGITPDIRVSNPAGGAEEVFA